MTSTWRPRDSRGHYLASKDVHTTLGPEDWDDTCRHQPRLVELPPSAEDFGHRPVIGFVDGRGLVECCARCVAIMRGPGIWWQADVPWPCTSAIVLGLDASA